MMHSGRIVGISELIDNIKIQLRNEFAFEKKEERRCSQLQIC